MASLSNVGITGAMFVEIDKQNARSMNLSPKLTFTPEHTVIASKPSEIKKLFREIEEIAMKIQSIDFKGISDQALTVFATANKVMTDAQFGAISADIRTLLASINTAANPKRLESIAKNMDQTVIASRTLMDRATEDLTRMDAILAQLQATLDTNRPHIDTTLGALATTALKADAFMTQSHATMFEMQATIKELQDRLAVTAENLEQTSSNLNSLITNAKDQPSLLIFGQPKPPRKVEE